MNRKARHVRIASYNSWVLGGNDAASYDAALAILAKAEHIPITPQIACGYDWGTPYNGGWDSLHPENIRAINPVAKVYLCPQFGTKFTDLELGDPIYRQNPLTWASIDANDYRLRDNEGNPYEGGDLGNQTALDSGKAGYGAAYLAALQPYLEAYQYDGVVFDGAPGYYANNHLWDYPDYDSFLDFLAHSISECAVVTDWLKANGYRVVVNVNCPWTNSLNATDTARRALGDATITERLCLDWTAGETWGAWLDAATVKSLVTNLQNDPKELWVSEIALNQDDSDMPITDFAAKRVMSFALYLIGAAADPSAPRSYGARLGALAHWDTLYDLDLGRPMGTAVEITNYVWRRLFSKGLVLANYTDTPIGYTVTQDCWDPDGGTVSAGPRTLGAMSADILRYKTVQRTTGGLRVTK